MNQNLDFLTCPLAGVYVIRRNPIRDKRGFFERFFCSTELESIGMKQPIAQINHTLTRCKGTVRGFHYQNPPYTETKIVSCIRGKVFDVAVDIRRGSSTFLQWHGEILSEESNTSLYIPDGFAHGFQALTDNCEMFYLHTMPYQAEAEGALNVQDPCLNVHWPLEITELSDRDRGHPMISDDFFGVTV